MAFQHVKRAVHCTTHTHTHTHTHIYIYIHTSVFMWVQTRARVYPQLFSCGFKHVHALWLSSTWKERCTAPHTHTHTHTHIYIYIPTSFFMWVQTRARKMAFQHVKRAVHCTSHIHVKLNTWTTILQSELKLTVAHVYVYIHIHYLLRQFIGSCMLFVCSIHAALCMCM